LIATRLLFAGLAALDSIPLVTPILKITGLIYGGRFVWRYLIREQNRQELIELLNRTKAEVLGNQN
jgi:CAAD domains of cyanobacterial aminoacyl-tRNA synthetase